MLTYSRREAYAFRNAKRAAGAEADLRKLGEHFA